VQAVLDVYEDGDAVFVQDFHLMLVPSLLRAAKPHMKIGFFL
jgi:trehalose-6-phosphate synthase